MQTSPPMPAHEWYLAIRSLLVGLAEYFDGAEPLFLVVLAGIMHAVVIQFIRSHARQQFAQRLAFALFLAYFIYRYWNFQPIGAVELLAQVGWSMVVAYASYAPLLVVVAVGSTFSGVFSAQTAAIRRTALRAGRWLLAIRDLRPSGGDGETEESAESPGSGVQIRRAKQ